MKPFVWVTALLLAAIFLAGAVFTGIDVVSHAEIIANPELKVAAGWLVTGLMLLSLGVRGWRTRQRNSESRPSPPASPPPA
jgi:hypothetical protein